jgi:hypothetical protein
MSGVRYSDRKELKLKSDYRLGSPAFSVLW